MGTLTLLVIVKMGTSKNSLALHTKVYPFYIYSVTSNSQWKCLHMCTKTIVRMIIIAEIGNNPNVYSWKNGHIFCNIHMMKYYTALKMTKLHIYITTCMSLKHKVKQKKPDPKEYIFHFIYSKIKQAKLNYDVYGMCTWVNKEGITMEVWIVGNFMGREGDVIQGSGVLGEFS